MALTNRDGVPVDPVPWFVVIGLAAMVLLSFGPIYGTAFGLSIQAGIIISGALTVVAAILSYYRMIWLFDPVQEAELTGELRLRRLIYLMAILIAVGLLLTIPLL